MVLINVAYYHIHSTIDAEHNIRLGSEDFMPVFQRLKFKMKIAYSSWKKDLYIHGAQVCRSKNQWSSKMQLILLLLEPDAGAAPYSWSSFQNDRKNCKREIPAGQKVVQELLRSADFAKFTQLGAAASAVWMWYELSEPVDLPRTCQKCWHCSSWDICQSPLAWVYPVSIFEKPPLWAHASLLSYPERDDRDRKNPQR